MTLTGKERAALRSDANRLTATVHMGHHGVTDALVGALDDALRTHELVKVQLVKQVSVSAKDAAQALATATRADVVQVIGKTTTLYRRNPDLERRPGAKPPWQR